MRGVNSPELSWHLTNMFKPSKQIFTLQRRCTNKADAPTTNPCDILMCAITHTLPLVCACISPPCLCPEDPAWSPQWHSVQHHGGHSLLPSAASCGHSHPCHVPLSQIWEPGTWSSPAVHIVQHSVGHSCQSTKIHCWMHELNYVTPWQK